MPQTNHRELSLSEEQIAAITGAPVENVIVYWPLVRRALEKESITDRLSLIAALATIAVEDPEFKPEAERGDSEYFTELYENRTDLGNVSPGDGAKFHGRGFIQLTGRANYRLFGTLVSVDLINNPDRALDPLIAARIFAVFFRLRGIPQAAQEGNWRKVRYLVNGGFNGMERFLHVVQRLVMVA